MNWTRRAACLAALAAAIAGGCVAAVDTRKAPDANERTRFVQRVAPERAAPGSAVASAQACHCGSGCACDAQGDACHCGEDAGAPACACSAAGVECACSAAGGGCGCGGPAVLTVSRAVQIALLANGELQDMLAEFGVDASALVRSGLLEADTPGAFRAAIARALSGSLAGPALDAVNQRLGEAVLDITSAARASYFTAVGAAEVADTARASAEVAQAAADFAARLLEAGNVSELEFLHEAARNEEAWVESEGTAAEAREARAELVELLGGASAFALPERLPALPDADPSRDELERLALGARGELAAAQHQAEMLAEVLRLRGAAADASPRLDARRGLVADELSSIEADVRDEVAAAATRLDAARRVAERLRDRVLPLRARIVELTQKEYNYMLTGTFELLESRREELEARAGLAAAVRDYWTARAELARVVGGDLSGFDAAPPAAPEPAPATSSHAHHSHHGG